MGVYDLAGNVWEWCHDEYGPYSDQPQQNPTGPAEGTGRVLCGGSWDVVARDARSACRLCYVPDVRRNNFGFRLVGSIVARTL